MGEAASQIVTCARYPGWRAKLVHDIDAGEPCGDALAPALLVAGCGLARFAQGVYVPEPAAQIVAAWYRLADYDRFCRYLRICHGVSSVAAATTAQQEVLVFDTAEFRRHVGATAPAVDLSGEQAEWRAWLDGDVYGVIVQRHRTGTTRWDDGTTSAASTWREVDSVWGLFGYDIAYQQALDLLQQHAAG